MADAVKTPAILDTTHTMRFKVYAGDKNGKPVYKNVSIGAINEDATDAEFLAAGEAIENLMDANVVEMRRVKNDHVGYRM